MNHGKFISASEDTTLSGRCRDSCDHLVDEKHYGQLPRRLSTPLIREVLAAPRRQEISATATGKKLDLGRTRP
jgi:hypothetical protein